MGCVLIFAAVIFSVHIKIIGLFVQSKYPTDSVGQIHVCVMKQVIMVTVGCFKELVMFRQCTEK